ncbi:elongation factor Tu-like isoform X2 [Halictus rubicundus]|uniref:elongation factor Tu-like isoform X2 n=1 Tax=Halictus rubicundus TaxID=77578 RepID=UPI00403524E2
MIVTDLYKKYNIRQIISCKDLLKFKQSVQYYCTEAKSAKEEICNVGTIGHVDHGKTTLTAAITKHLSEIYKDCKYVSYNEIDKAPEEQKRGITINIAHIGYMTKKRRYSHTDCPGHADFIKNMISGASQMEGAILVVAADDGPMPQTKEHLLLIKQIGIKHVIVYINKVDLADEEICELIEIEIRELLSAYGFNGIDTPVIRGSALLALNGDKSEIGVPSIELLLNALDNIPTQERDYASPFIVPIDNIFTVPGRGTVVVGTMVKGTIKKGEAVDLLGFNEKMSTYVSDIQIFRKSVPVAQAGDNIGILLRGIKLKSIRRGMLLSKSNSLNLTNHFEVQFYLLSEEEGGRRNSLPLNGFCTMIYCSTWNVYSRFDFLLPAGTNMLMPGEFATARLTLLFRMPVIDGQVFTVRERNQTIGTGKVTKVLEEIPVHKRKMHQVKVKFDEI